MRPTRRGYAVGIVVLGALALGAVFGARALDAVVIPGALALVAAVVQVWRAPTPEVERTLPPADVPGVTGTVELTLDAPSSYPATVRDRLPPDVDSGASTGTRAVSSGDAGGEPTATHEAVVAGATDADIAYEITPRRRGEHELGPVTVVVTDVLGLLKRATTVDERDGLVVFPAVGVLADGVQADLRTLTQSPRADRREEFDDLREYVRGDALRDVHWKSSAKRGNLMVREFTAEADPDQVRVVAGIESGGGAGTERTAASKSTTAVPEAGDTADDAADRMAEAAATVCLSLLRSGASVALTTPSGRVEATPGATRPLLDHLAVAGAGPVPTHEADVVVVADGESASLRFDGREHRLDEMTTDAGDVSAATEREVVG
jgi:uncharacterized protein (DUF58 family)